MTEPSPALRTFRDMQRLHREAIDQARLAYEFAPNSYTFSCLSACLAVEKTIEVLRDHMSDHFETSNPDQSWKGKSNVHDRVCLGATTTAAPRRSHADASLDAAAKGGATGKKDHD